MQSILWPGGVYTDATYANDARIMIPYSDKIVNHNYIGSLGCIPDEPKTLYIHIQILASNMHIQDMNWRLGGLLTDDANNNDDDARQQHMTDNA